MIWVECQAIPDEGCPISLRYRHSERHNAHRIATLGIGIGSEICQFQCGDWRARRRTCGGMETPAPRFCVCIEVALSPVECPGARWAANGATSMSDQHDVIVEQSSNPRLECTWLTRHWIAAKDALPHTGGETHPHVSELAG